LPLLRHRKLVIIFSQPDDAVEEEDVELPAPGGGLDLCNEIVTFPTNCPVCGAPNDTNMKVRLESKAQVASSDACV